MDSDFEVEELFGEDVSFFLSPIGTKARLNGHRVDGRTAIRRFEQVHRIVGFVITGENCNPIMYNTM